jgi:uncharacterized protein YecA (UPF0149 family)
VETVEITDDKQALLERMEHLLAESERLRRETLAAHAPGVEALALEADKADHEAATLAWHEGGRQGDRPRLGKAHRLELARRQRELPKLFNEALRDLALTEVSYHELRSRELREEVEKIEDSLPDLLAAKEAAEAAYEEAESRRVSLTHQELRAGGMASQARLKARNISERLKSKKFFEET